MKDEQVGLFVPGMIALAGAASLAIRGKQHSPDDVTSVVIRVQEEVARTMEVVA